MDSLHSTLHGYTQAVSHYVYLSHRKEYKYEAITTNW